MSLPTKAIIRSADGVEIGRQSINCGWYATAVSLARVLLHDIKDEGYTDTDIISLYEIDVPVKLLREVKDAKELEKHLEVIIEEYNKQYQRRTES